MWYTLAPGKHCLPTVAHTSCARLLVHSMCTCLRPCLYKSVKEIVEATTCCAAGGVYVEGKDDYRFQPANKTVNLCHKGQRDMGP